MEDEDTIDVFQSQTGGCFWSGNYFSDQNFAILGKWFDLLCLNDIAILRNTWQNYSNKIWWKNNIYRSQSMWEILFFCVFLFAGILKQKKIWNFNLAGLRVSAVQKIPYVDGNRKKWVIGTVLRNFSITSKKPLSLFFFWFILKTQ